MMLDKKLIFVFGCQRSGTTATIDGLKQVDDLRVFDEDNQLTNRYHQRYDKGLALRLKPLEELRDVFAECQERTLVVKPLVESQNANSILEFFETAVGLWLFRDFRDVVCSMLEKWGDRVGMTPLESIVQRRQGDWRSEKVDDAMREFVKATMDRLPLSPADAAALFWYLRNLHYFRQGLDRHRRVRLIDYAQLVSDPRLLPQVLGELGMGIDVPPGIYHRNSVAKGRDLAIHPIVRQLCDGMFGRLQLVAGF